MSDRDGLFHDGLPEGAYLEPLGGGLPEDLRAAQAQRTTLLRSWWGKIVGSVITVGDSSDDIDIGGEPRTAELRGKVGFAKRTVLVAKRPGIAIERGAFDRTDLGEGERIELEEGWLIQFPTPSGGTSSYRYHDPPEPPEQDDDDRDDDDGDDGDGR